MLAFRLVILDLKGLLLWKEADFHASSHHHHQNHLVCFDYLFGTRQKVKLQELQGCFLNLRLLGVSFPLKGKVPCDTEDICQHGRSI